MKKRQIKTMALLCTVLLASSKVMAADPSEAPTTFDELKKQIEDATSGEELVIEGIGSALQFSDTLDITGKKVKLSGVETEEGGFTPTMEGETATFKKNAFKIGSGGELTIENLNITGFGAKDFTTGLEAAVAEVDKDGKLTIGPGVTIADSVKMAAYTYGAAITNEGTVNIQTKDGGDVTFQKVPIGTGRDAQHDIEMYSGSNLVIGGTGGKVTFENGIIANYGITDAKITHNGDNEISLSGSNSYSGEFINEKGTLTVENGITSFFTGSSTFKNDSTLNWMTGNIGHGRFDLQDNTKLNVGDDSVSASLALNQGTDTISQNTKMNVGTNSTLSLSGYNGGNKSLTLKKQIGGSGKLNLTNDNITFDGTDASSGDKAGLSKDLQLTTNSSTLTLKKLSEDSETLTAIAKGTNTNTDIVLEDYSGSLSDDATLTVNGSGVKTLTFQGSKNDVTGNLTVSNTGVATNKQNTTTAIKGDVTIENGSDSAALVNEKDATLEIKDGTNGFKNSGKVSNEGNLTVNKGSNSGTISGSGNFTSKGDFTNDESGEITTSGKFNVEGSLTNSNNITVTDSGNLTVGKDLTNKSKGQITSSNGISVTGKIQNENDGASITATKGDITADNITSNNGKIEAAAGDITVTNGVSNTAANAFIKGKNLKFGSLAQNEGTIESTEGKIEVTNDVANNAGTITSKSTLTVGGTLSNTGTVSMVGGSLNNIENNTEKGSITNNGGELTITGTVSGSGKEIKNENGTVNLNGNASAYQGGYSQSGTNAVTNVTTSASAFGGENTIEGGSYNVTGGGVDGYQGTFKLGSGATFSHKGEGGTIKDGLITYTGSGATAKFEGGSSDITLNKAFSGSENNNIEFNNSTVKLGESGTEYNFKNFKFNNSTLKLSDDSTQGTLDNYTLHNFQATGDSHLDLDLRMKKDEDGSRYLDSDKLTFKDESSGSLKLGNVYITKDDDTVENGDNFATREDIIKNEGNANVTLDKSQPDKVHVGSNLFTYDLEVNDKTVGLTISGYGDKDTLYELNKEEGDRKFFVDSSVGEYHIGKSLDSEGDSASTKAGTFYVYGAEEGSNDAVLSGLVKGSTEKGSLFEIKDTEGEVTLSVKDLTVKDANSTSRGGSVLNNNNSSSKVTFDNVIVTENSSDNEKGGAIYNNGGSPDGSKGLTVQNSKFSKNKTTTSGGKGGAIYNDTNGYLTLQGVEVAAAEGDAQNDVYNAGTTVTKGTNKFSSLFTNAKDLTIEGDDTFANLQSDDGTITVKGSNVKFEKVTGEKGTITHEQGNLTLGDASGYKSTYTQKSGTTLLDKDSKFFGGVSTFEGGNLYWYSENDTAGTLDVKKGATLFVGDNETKSGKLTLNKDSKIEDGAKVQISSNGELDIKGGEVTLNGTTEEGGGATVSWLGTIQMDEGTLNLNNVNSSSSSILAANGGTLKLEGESNLNISGQNAKGVKSTIAGDVQTTIGEKSYVAVGNDGSVTLNSGDTWQGGVIVNGNNAKLTLDNFSGENGLLAAQSGEVGLINNSTVVLKGNDDFNGFINEDVKTTIDAGSTVDVQEKGYLNLNSKGNGADDWKGTVKLNGGTFDYGMEKMEGKLNAESGNLNLLSDSVIDIGEGSDIKDKVTVDIGNGATVNVDAKGEFTIDSETNDQWKGTVNNQGGTFTTEGISNRGQNGGKLHQTSGTSVFDKESDIVITGTDNTITGGSIHLEDHSKLTFTNGNNITLDDLKVTDESQFNIMNREAQNTNAKELKVDGNGNFTADFNLRGGNSDKFTLESITTDSSGVINVSDFDFIGGAPIYRNVELQLFDAESIDENVKFVTTNKRVMTPVGSYGLESIGGGRFSASLREFNPQVFRGQVATLAMFNNQRTIDDLMLNHIMLQSEKGSFLNGSNAQANRYAAVNPLLAPYQYSKKDGGLWYKAYGDFEHLSMTHHLNVDSMSYGSLVGADFGLKELKHGWEYIPTLYVGYNGAHQNFKSVSMYQNGGQLGYMGTFLKNDFITSILAYGGGYYNQMSVSGYNDETANWFVGTATKMAYNFHPAKYFTIQPTAYISYNMFGEQNWHSDFGDMGMNAGMLNGINVAPGLNLIWARDTWSVYTTVQYMYNINDQVGGRAGADIYLPTVKMRHGFIQYGVGATKNWNDRFNSYGQVVARNGGRTGVGLQLGCEFLLDFFEIKNLFKEKSASK